MPAQTRSRPVVWKPLVVCPQPDFHQRLLAALTEIQVEQPTMLAEYPASGAAGALLERNGSNICFLDTATDAERAQELISEFAGAVPVVALHPRNDADLILRCLRRGASEFVADPTVEVVQGVLERLSRGARRRLAPCARRDLLRGAGEARMRRQHGGRTPGDSIPAQRLGPGSAGGRRSSDGQYRVYSQA